MKNNTLNTIIVIIILIIIGAIVWTSKAQQQLPESNTPVQPVVSETQPMSICFYHRAKTARGFYDRAWLHMDINKDMVTGEYRNLPAETDSKIGTFDGTISPVDQTTGLQTANVWWNSLAEGMSVKEELMIAFGKGEAYALFGEMMDRGDGVYVYKDKSKVTHGMTMTQIDCGDLDEIISIEKYVRDNIASIATNKAVAGGTWYVVSVIVNGENNTGTVVYEDGHIQSTANFSYTFNETTKIPTISNFTIAK